MADTVDEMNRVGFTQVLKALIAGILKDHAEKPTLEMACVQLVDALVDKVLEFDQELANIDIAKTDVISEEQVNTRRILQQRLIASLAILAAFAHVRPSLLVRHADILVPYLTSKSNSPTDLQTLTAILQILQRVVPLIDHPSDAFLRGIDTRIDELLNAQSLPLLVNSEAVECSGAIYQAFPKFCPKLFDRFAKFLRGFTDYNLMVDELIVASDYLQMTSSQPVNEIEAKSLVMLRK